jgi:hypothetical protein
MRHDQVALAVHDEHRAAHLTADRLGGGVAAVGVRRPCGQH